MQMDCLKKSVNNLINNSYKNKKKTLFMLNSEFNMNKVFFYFFYFVAWRDPILISILRIHVVMS